MNHGQKKSQLHHRLLGAFFTIAAQAQGNNGTSPVDMRSKSKKCLQDPFCESFGTSGKSKAARQIRLTGHAMNFTANEESGVKLHLVFKDDKYEGTIHWDNVTLTAERWLKAKELKTWSRGRSR